MSDHRLDDGFENQLRKSLRDSTNFDDDIKRELALARQKALSRRQSSRLPLAAAASVLLATASVSIYVNYGASSTANSFEHMAWELEPELLDTMDMLEIFGEEYAG